jgi:DNA polymerase-3 subunit beta
MKFTIEKQTLASAIERITAVIERRNTIPILANVLISAHEDLLTIKGTDLDMEVSSVAPCEIAASGETTVPAALLAGIVSKLSKDALVQIELKGDQVIVTSGKSKFKLPTLDAEGFPSLDAGDLDGKISVDADMLKSRLNRIAYAMSQDETRYYLNGVFMHQKDGALRMVGTNGHMLAMTDCESDSSGLPESGVIVPLKLVRFLQKALDFGAVEISLNDSKIKVDAGAWVIVSKLIEGTFPDYERVLPQDMPSCANVDVKEIIAATARVASVGEAQEKSMAFEFTGEGLKLSMTASGGYAEDFCQIAGDYSECRIGLNHKNVTQTMAALTGKNADVFYKDPVTAIKIVDEIGVSVIMPMRLKDAS